MDLPQAVEQLCDELIAADGIERVVLGGSRATGTHGPASDWDIGVHYRSGADFSAIRERGEFHIPGSWGFMNGGAWLELDGDKVDVLLRDLETVALWTDHAENGVFGVYHLLGYIAGIPTYSLAAELAIAVVLRGDEIDRPEVSDALAEIGGRRWRMHRDFSLGYAESLIARADPVVAGAHLVKACLEEAHARNCERHTWVLNEKGLLEGAGLSKAAERARAGLVDEVRTALGA